MLELRDVSLTVGSRNDPVELLSQISAVFPRNHFAAIIGPSGCGKTTLLKTIAGIAHGEEQGTIFWNKRDLQDEDFEPSEIGYVPQFSLAHPELTVQESVEMALRLRVSGISAERRGAVAAHYLAEVGLDALVGQRVALLSGGQLRRLSLAIEIVSRPHILLCDEVTSGLDARSEDEIVRLLHKLAKGTGRLVISVTHSLQHLELYDSVMVLTGGKLAYHGPANTLLHYYRIERVEDLYDRLNDRTPQDWSNSWKKHRRPFEDALLLSAKANPDSQEGRVPSSHSTSCAQHAPPAGNSPQSPGFAEQPDTNPAAVSTPAGEEVPDGPDLPPAIPPGPVGQFRALLERRILIFSRSIPQVLMQTGLILGFPLLVAIFAWDGVPNVKNLSMQLGLDVVTQLIEAKEFLVQASHIGSLMSGIIMFQVILLTLMGANNSGREIAAERLIFEKEKLSGVGALSYVASKAAFLGVLVTVQSLWMGLFVHFVCGMPGDLLAQISFLWLVNAAMTSVCLAISSWLGTAEQASLASIYLVGFQLPLSGAVLALPAPLDVLTRPFIAAYWSWSGILQTLRGERYYDIVQMVAQTTLSPAGLCVVVLLFHIFFGLTMAWLGCIRQKLG